MGRGRDHVEVAGEANGRVTVSMGHPRFDGEYGEVELSVEDARTFLHSLAAAINRADGWTTCARCGAMMKGNPGIFSGVAHVCGEGS